MSQKILCVIGLIVLVCSTVVHGADDGQTNSSTSSSSPSSTGVRSILRIYDECQRSDGGMTMCLKKKAVTFIDRISKIDVVNLGDGIKVIGLENDIKVPKTLSENDLDQMLPRSLEDRDYFLTNMLADKIAHYISGRNIQISLPKVTSSDIGRGLEEGEYKQFFFLLTKYFSINVNSFIIIII